MSDPATASAKATEAVAQAAGTALDIIHDMGGYLRQVFAEVPADLVGVLGGAWLHERRIRIRARLRKRTEQLLKDWGVKEIAEISPNVAAALIEAAQEEDREELAELWARLLANAMAPKMNTVRASFIEAVKKMDPPDARLLRFLHQRGIRQVARTLFNAHSAQQASIKEIAGELSCRDDEVDASLDHLLSFGFFEQTEANRNWSPNAKFREFMRACYPEMG